MFFKIVFLKKFANFTGKHRCQSLLNKVAAPQNYTFIRKRLQLRFFPVNFLNYLRTPILQRIYEQLVLKHHCTILRVPFLTEHLQWLLLTVSAFQPASLLKKRLRQRCLSVNFAKFLRTSFDRTPPYNCFLCLSVNYEKFSDHLFYIAGSGNYLFHVQVSEFQPPDTVKNYFTSAFQAFYIRERSGYLKPFIYLKSLGIICEEVNL